MSVRPLLHWHSRPPAKFTQMSSQPKQVKHVQRYTEPRFRIKFFTFDNEKTC
jgi:hypothetical protein